MWKRKRKHTGSPLPTGTGISQHFLVFGCSTLTSACACWSSAYEPHRSSAPLSFVPKELKWKGMLKLTTRASRADNSVFSPRLLTSTAQSGLLATRALSLGGTDAVRGATATGCWFCHDFCAVENLELAVRTSQMG